MYFAFERSRTPKGPKTLFDYLREGEFEIGCNESLEDILSGWEIEDVVVFQIADCNPLKVSKEKVVVSVPQTSYKYTVKK